MPQPRNIEDAQYVEAELDAQAERIAEAAIEAGLTSDNPETVWATIMAYGSVVYEHAKQCLGVTANIVSLTYPWILSGSLIISFAYTTATAIASGMTVSAFLLGISFTPIWNAVLITAGVAVVAFVAVAFVSPAVDYIVAKIKAAWNWLFSREPEAAPAAA